MSIPQLTVGPQDTASLILSDSSFNCDSINLSGNISITGNLCVSSHLQFNPTSITSASVIHGDSYINGNNFISNDIYLGITSWKLNLDNDGNLNIFQNNNNSFDLIAIFSKSDY